MRCSGRGKSGTTKSTFSKDVKERGGYVPLVLCHHQPTILLSLQLQGLVFAYFPVVLSLIRQLLLHLPSILSHHSTILLNTISIAYMYPSSSSGSAGIPNSEMPKTGGVKRDAGSGGTISVNGPAVYPGAPKSSVPSFAAVVSSSSASGKTNSPFCSPTKTTSSTLLRQKHPQPPSSSDPSSPPGNNSDDNKNNFINSTTFTTGNGIAINTSAQSTMASSSSAASPPCMRNNSEGDTPLDNSNDEAENDQEDSESSDVEIYLDSNNSTARMNVLSGTNSAYSPGATSSKGNQMPISSYLNTQSPFHLPTQTKTGHAPITEDQGTIGDQEKRGPDQVSVLGTYGNGTYIDAHTYNPTSNDRTHNRSLVAPSFVNNQIPSLQQWPQGIVHEYANPSTSSLSGSPGKHPPLPDMKCAMQTTALSPVDDSGNQIPQSTRMPNPSSSITIDLANLSITGDHFGGGAPLTLGSLTAGNAGSSHQGQMGMIVSSSQPAFNSRSTTPYATLNGIFTSSLSDPGLCGLADGGNGSESAGSASENGTASCVGVVKTPNVYINGLAPHFPEDELFNLCNEFGPIRSVRTFTRHAKDTESGYGFVLFESIDDADKCINEIRRRYKNLHPTFSKQIHKIPGTNYAAGPSTSWNVSVTGDDVGANGGFKAKMESLHDPASTNLYMEGLPLSIDEPTLSALVSPHQIVSSRFFQTRLSDPPKIIAFVRLETRVGAEEVIERLHGRMVRGWNDTGSRITVRFADTSKQRDLRKERAAQETDTSPSRLTIAQASLLNLRGQDLRPSAKPMQPTHTGNTLSLPTSSSSRGFSTSVSAPDFSSNGSFAHHGHSSLNLPIIGNGLGRTTPGPTIGGGHSGVSDYSLAFGGSNVVRSRSPYAREYLQPQVDQQHAMLGQHSMGRFRHGRETMLDSLSGASVPYADHRRGHEEMLLNEEIEENFYSQNSGMRFPRHQVHGLPYGQHHLPISQSVDSMLAQTYSRPSPVYTRSGYTPAEEYIMRAHAENAALSQAQRQQPNHVNYQPQRLERGRPLPLALSRPDAEPAGNIAVGMRAYRAQASLMSPTVSTSTSTNSLSSFGSAGEPTMGDGGFGLPPISGIMTEEDFHAGETMSSATLMSLKNLHASRLSRELRSYQKSGALSPFLPVSSSSMSQNQDHSISSPSSHPAEASLASMVSPNPNDTILSAYQQQSASTHMRSTTLPQHRPSGIANGRIRGHHQHSSMSIPKQNLGTPQHASVARLGGNPVLVEESSAIYEYDAQDKFQAEVGGGRLGSSNSAHHGNVGSSLPLKTHYSSSAIFGDAEQSSSPLSASSSLISPTLTYASRTPSTLSPPTPFFGSFNSNMEGFDKTGASDHRQPGQKELIGENGSRGD